MVTIDELKELAEKERCAGNRQKFLDIQKQIDIQKEERVLASHLAYLESTKKDFPVGFYIPELHAKVIEIKDGCGTQRGWIYIYLSGYGDKHFTPSELRKKISKAQEGREANDYFDKLKFSDTKQSLYIGKENLDTLDMLIRVMSLDIPTTQEVEESLLDYPSEVYDYTFKQAKEDGYTDEEAEEKAREAESEERDDEFKKYMQDIIRTINYLLNFHGIELEVIKKRYYITSKSWKETANKVASTITGYGMFEYNSGKELKEGLPCRTYCEAAIQHLHWLKYYPEVYGETSYRRIYER